jgi:hypothetical protein
MEEGTSKAIPLRRSRTGARTVTQPGTRWSERLATSARSVLAPPRQLWLAGVGGTALALRAAREAWSRAVAEGAAVEEWVRGSIRREPEAR